LKTPAVRRPDSDTLLLWLVLVPAGLFAAVLVVTIFTLTPGASLLVAVDCFTEGSCGMSVIRAGRVFTSHSVGWAAYLTGALLIAMAVAMGNVVVTALPGLSKLTQRRDAHGKERTRYGIAYFCLLAGFLLLDTALVRALGYAIEGR
jgi:hypothetical protein